MRPVQLTIDGQAVPVKTRGGRECAAAAHEKPERLFEPAPEQIAGQSSIPLEVAESDAECRSAGSPGTPS